MDEFLSRCQDYINVFPWTDCLSVVKGGHYEKQSLQNLCLCLIYTLADQIVSRDEDIRWLSVTIQQLTDDKIISSFHLEYIVLRCRQIAEAPVKSSTGSLPKNFYS